MQFHAAVCFKLFFKCVSFTFSGFQLKKITDFIHYFFLCYLRTQFCFIFIHNNQQKKKLNLKNLRFSEEPKKSLKNLQKLHQLRDLSFFLKCVKSDYELNFNNTMTKTDR